MDQEIAAEIEIVRENEKENLVDAMAENVKVAEIRMMLDGLATSVEENEAAREAVVDEEMIFEANHVAKTDAMVVDLETMLTGSAPVMVKGLVTEVMRRGRADR